MNVYLEFAKISVLQVLCFTVQSQALQFTKKKHNSLFKACSLNSITAEAVTTKATVLLGDKLTVRQVLNVLAVRSKRVGAFASKFGKQFQL